MNEHRRQILEMLAAGKISADEAERLIDALDNEPSSASGSASAKPFPKYLRVTVDADEARGDDTLTKVNIRIPIQLLRAGVRLTGLIPNEARDRVNEALREKGVAFDVNQLRPENLEDLIEQLNELTVDVDDGHGQHVKVFCE